MTLIKVKSKGWKKLATIWSHRRYVITLQRTDEAHSPAFSHQNFFTRHTSRQRVYSSRSSFRQRFCSLLLLLVTQEDLMSVYCRQLTWHHLFLWKNDRLHTDAMTLTIIFSYIILLLYHTTSSTTSKRTFSLLSFCLNITLFFFHLNFFSSTAPAIFLTGRTLTVLPSAWLEETFHHILLVFLIQSNKPQNDQKNVL